MKKNMLIIAIVLMVLATAGIASAHFTMIFPSDDENMWNVTPEDYIAELGDTKTIYLAWGHPYEHISFDMDPEVEVSITKPNETVEQLELEEVIVDGMDEDGNMGTFVAYKASFDVDQLGDTVISVKYEDEEEGMIDYTKAVIHCGEEMWTGWDAEVGQETEIIPYMRPYGMEEGFVFAGKALYDGEPLAGADVEVEVYHELEAGIEIVEAAKEMFPYDAPMVFTRLTTSNDDGDFVYTLDEPGIWFVGATMEPENGQPVRGVFIVPVLEEFPASEELDLAELQEAVEEAQQTAEEAKDAANSGSASAPGFEAAFAAIGMLAAILIISRRK